MAWQQEDFEVMMEVPLEIHEVIPSEKVSAVRRQREAAIAPNQISA